MTMREAQAETDGKLAFASGKPASSCSRRCPEQRAAWMRGYEAERRLHVASTATPEQLAESSAVIGRLKDFAATL
jgi:hypothetical protein